MCSRSTDSSVGDPFVVYVALADCFNSASGISGVDPRESITASFDKILQLSNVPGPVIIDQCSHRVLRDAFDSPLHLLCKLVCKEMYEQWNIFRSLTQRRYSYRKNIEPIVQVAAKLLFFHQLDQISIRRCNYTDIHALGSGTPQPFEFLFLKYTQEF